MKKKLMLVLGWLMVAFGAAGIVLPLLPATPFFLLAAALFSGSSEKAYKNLVKNPWFGPFIEHYRTGRGIRRGRKIQAILTLWGFLALSVCLIQKAWASVLFPVIGLAVTIHLLWIKTENPTSGKFASKEDLLCENKRGEG